MGDGQATTQHPSVRRRSDRYPPQRSSPLSPFDGACQKPHAAGETHLLSAKASEVIRGVGKVGIGDEASGKGCSIDIARKGRLDGEVSPVQEETGLKVASSFLYAVGFLKPDLGFAREFSEPDVGGKAI